MELALWSVVGALVLWNFYLHGKVKEKSIAAKTQQILRDWKLGKKEAWEAEYNGGQPIEECRLVEAKQNKEGYYTFWKCSCKQTGKSHTTDFGFDYSRHQRIMKLVAK